MRILVVGTSVVPIGYGLYGGIEKLCYDFVEGLKEAGQQVIVAAPEGSRVPEGVSLIETVKLPEEQDRDYITLAMLHELKPDFDCIHDFSHSHVVSQIPRMDSNRLPSINMLWDNITHRYNKATYNIVCLSDWQRQRFEKAYNQKAIVMPMCVDTKRYKPVSVPRRERMLFLGKISPEKGVHLAIQYCKELGLPLDVCGGLIPSEVLSPYLSEIHRLCDGKDIKLHFNVTEEEKIDFLQNAKAVIYPVQQQEAHWLVGIEAAACGTITITFDVGSFREVCYGFVVGSEEDFKRTMKHMSWMSDLTPDMWAEKYYSRERVIPKYLELYKEVSEGRRW